MQRFAFIQWPAYYSLLYHGLFLSMVVCAGAFANSNTTDGLLADNPQLQEQRQNYKLANEAFLQDKKETYEKLKTKLQGYPLYPYLEYSEIVSELDRLTRPQVDQFLAQYPDSYLADQLLKYWLQQLAKRRDWQNYKNYYKPGLYSTSLYCGYLWSQFKAGDNTIYPQVTSLWNVGKSQPAECDEIFNEWRKRGYLTPEIAWERHKKAIEKGNHRLARHISRSMPKSMQSLAELYRRIDKNPAMVADNSLFHKGTLANANRDIIAHGVRKYAGSDAEAAYSLWQQYRQQYNFSSEDQARLNLHIAIWLAKEGHISDAAQLAISHSKNFGNFYEPIVVDTILRELLRQQQWHDILVWIERLPITEKESEQWRYWQARALANTPDHSIHQLNAQQENSQQEDSQQKVQSIYRELSKNRSYYGFLAADRIGLNYTFTHKPAAIDIELMQQVKTIPALQRALELFALGKMYAARDEWSYAAKNLTDKQHIAAAQLAASWGWNQKAIESMAAAKYWDDLNIRFPLAHSQWIGQASEQLKLADTLVYAIARQESAWAADALSPVGAVGLMQLMPNTAKQTARTIGLSYNRERLFQPEYNITIGSRYIDGLIHKYDGNRLLAIAAYNAGPSRVNRWLELSGQKLPYDIWVEVIPFKETRKYVQNVLYYKVIYDYRTGRSVALITPDEARQTL